MDDRAVLRRVVVLTGSIASGKTTASRLLAELGAFVVSADELARRVVEPGREELVRIRETFGDGVFDQSGALDRKALAAIIFADPTKRAELERITHPAIHRLAIEEFRRGLASGAPLIVYDCPLYYEAGLDERPFRNAVLIAAPTDVALARIRARDGLSEEEAQRRIDAQMNIDDKRRRADIVIENSGTVEELREKMQAVYALFTPDGEVSS